MLVDAIKFILELAAERRLDAAPVKEEEETNARLFGNF
jgi:hypothetical protein